MVKFLSPWCSSWPQMPSRYPFHDVLAACPLRGVENQDLKVTKCTHPAVTSAQLPGQLRISSDSRKADVCHDTEASTEHVLAEGAQVTLMLLLHQFPQSIYPSLPMSFGSETQRKAWKARAAQAVNYSGFQPHHLFLASASSFSEIWNASQLIFPG